MYSKVNIHHKTLWILTIPCPLFHSTLMMKNVVVGEWLVWVVLGVGLLLLVIWDLIHLLNYVSVKSAGFRAHFLESMLIFSCRILSPLTIVPIVSSQI